MSETLTPSGVHGIRLTVQGAVQGVGFRPFVYRLADELRLCGAVTNTCGGVVIEVEGTSGQLAEFRRRLRSDKPPLASILSCEEAQLTPRGRSGFEIGASDAHGARSALILPDIAICRECLRDVGDPANRRFRYPFTNCTHCGPRFSIIEALPYDRAHTSMKRFVMCPACQEEYDNPADRRFHAQPNACPLCGPQLELWSADGRPLGARDEALKAAATALTAGSILALKGLGGFQLLVSACNEDAVSRLRRRKAREEKPFAVMVRSLTEARLVCKVDEHEASILESPQAPIVLLARRAEAALSIAPGVAPRNPYLGVMLPYTPLHHLLIAELGFPVVATSGNVSDEPICIDEREAVTRLRGLADLFLVHNRPIVRHVDDSVVRMVHGRPMVLRRARGFAPLPVETGGPSQTVLALGAQQKSTVALSAHGRCFLSQHIGDLETPRALEAFERATGDLPALYDLQPSQVACDLHPDYVSTRCAERRHRRPIRVQHHHAHVVSCMAENGLEGTVLGVCWDGTGYGTDGTVWGGEFLRCSRAEFVRVAHLRTFALPGGDSAAHEPRRSALGLLYEILGDAAFERLDLPSIRAFDPTERRVLRRALLRRIQCPTTSSAGRLFDAVASLADVRQRTHHEGQAAMELEFAAEDDETTEVYPFQVQRSPVDDADSNSNLSRLPWIVDWEPLATRIVGDVLAHEPVSRIARRFHNTLVEMIVDVARRMNENRVVLSGGCFQNRLLTERTITRLEDEGFQPYWHQHVPPNDGGIALGQAVVAQHLRRTPSPCA